jgi:hypothetical protein
MSPAHFQSPVIVQPGGTSKDTPSDGRLTTKLGGGGQKRFSLRVEFDMIFTHRFDNSPSLSSRDDISLECIQVVQAGLLAVLGIS